MYFQAASNNPRRDGFFNCDGSLESNPRDVSNTFHFPIKWRCFTVPFLHFFHFYLSLEKSHSQYYRTQKRNYFRDHPRADCVALHVSYVLLHKNAYRYCRSNYSWFSYCEEPVSEFPTSQGRKIATENYYSWSFTRTRNVHKKEMTVKRNMDVIFRSFGSEWQSIVICRQVPNARMVQPYNWNSFLVFS